MELNMEQSGGFMQISSVKNYFNNAVKISNEALKELEKERFNSDTLKTLFYDKRFLSDEKAKTFVQSRQNGEPVKIYVDFFADTPFIDKKNRIVKFYDIKLYDDIAKEIPVATKHFRLERSGKTLKMQPGYMESNSDDYIGLGIREDQMQIETAIEKGLSNVPRTSYPEAILYHLKMGFTPVKRLIRVKNQGDVETFIKNIMRHSSMTEKDSITPIIVSKRSLFGKRYYYDENTTLTVAYLKKIKENLLCKKNMRPDSIEGALVGLELVGDNLQVWKNMLSGKPMFDGIKSNANIHPKNRNKFLQTLKVSNNN